MNKYEQKDGKSLIKNNKYFYRPNETDDDIKELLIRLAAIGAGRPVDSEGMPVSSWTAETLTEALAEVSDDDSTLDIRSVQHWFQSNERGISSGNIQKLAQIFGCDDPVAVGDYRVLLTRANARLATKRKLAKKSVVHSLGSAVKEIKHIKRGIAEVVIDNLVGKVSVFTLPSFVAMGNIFLIFFAFTLDLHDARYRTAIGPKQVGLLWAPNWTLIEFIFLPLFLIGVHQVYNYWNDWVRSLSMSYVDFSKYEVIRRKILNSHNLILWTIVIICIGIVFVYQWFGIYFHSFSNDDIGKLAVSWILLPLVADGYSLNYLHYVISFLAFFYTGLICFLYLLCLLVLQVIVQNFVAALPTLFSFRELNERNNGEVHCISERLISIYYVCGTVGILIPICIRIDYVYLQSDAANIFLWLLADFQSLWTVGDSALSGQKSMASISSLLLYWITVASFAFCFIKLFIVRSRYSANASYFSTWFSVLAITSLGFLLICFPLIGMINGFTYFLMAGLVGSLRAVWLALKVWVMR